MYVYKEQPLQFNVYSSQGSLPYNVELKIIWISVRFRYCYKLKSEAILDQRKGHKNLVTNNKLRSSSFTVWGSHAQPLLRNGGGASVAHLCGSTLAGAHGRYLVSHPL